MTWYWLPKLESIRCRIRINGAPEVSPVDVHLRIAKPPAPYLTHVRRRDETTLTTEVKQHHPDLPPIELLLTCPAEIADAIVRTLS